MIADHRKNQRHRHVCVVSRSEAGRGHLRRIGRRSFFRGGDDPFLIRPDNHPDVERHYRAEDRAGVYVERAAAEVTDIFEKQINAGEDRQVDRRAEDFVGERFHDRVVDHESDRQRDQHDHQP